MNYANITGKCFCSSSHGVHYGTVSSVENESIILTNCVFVVDNNDVPTDLSVELLATSQQEVKKLGGTSPCTLLITDVIEVAPVLLSNVVYYDGLFS